MTSKDEALKMAVEYFEANFQGLNPINSNEQIIQACKEALEQPAQEPVAWIYQSNSGHPALMWNPTNTFEYNSITASQPKISLYTHPAPSWQGLSDKEVLIICAKMAAKLPNKEIDLVFARAIEQALKNKNT